MERKANKPAQIEGFVAPDFHDVRREFERISSRAVKKVLPVRSTIVVEK